MSHLRNFLLLLLLQLTAFPLFACSQRPGETPPTDRELFEKAKAVFVAHVYRTEEKFLPIDSTEKHFAIAEGDFKVIEVLKGTPPADSKIKTFVFGPGNCSLPLMVGIDYIFFTQEGHEVVLWPDGSRPFTNIQATDSIKFLEGLRQMSPAKGQP